MNGKINSVFGILVIMFSPLIAYIIYIPACYFFGNEGCNQGEGIIFSFFMVATIPIGIVLLIGHSMRKNNEAEDFNIKNKGVGYRFFYGLSVVVLLAMISTIFYYMFF